MSARTVRSRHPDSFIEIHTQHEPRRIYSIVTVDPANFIQVKRQKLLAIKNTSLQRFLFLDCDTLVLDCWTRCSSLSKADLVRDQPASERAITAAGGSVFVLPPEFSVRFNEPIQIAGSIKILHGDGKWAEDPSLIGEFLNQDTSPRIFDRTTGIMMAYSPEARKYYECANDSTGQELQACHLDPSPGRPDMRILRSGGYSAE
jgi:hypothetical protein